ncbi:DUF697 domain-containing protein [Gloeocapsa sp. PCC 73106]|uniref:slr1306 family protein n=1 Tax=Gloeocapsa sp. PCC 73106 TaxID=102232 RepID=UPI0002ABBFA3|nr:DUF697 domain-containing protein [Gloeocapsa sp. PCC 73106]ELR97672.1 uncharacterized protein associated with GTPases [Gloeocapsa sp. PCC 73106]
MGVKLRKPILVAGIGLSVSLWLWESLGNSALEMGQWGLSAAIALVGGGLWLLQSKNKSKQKASQMRISLTPESVNKAIATTQEMLNTLALEEPEPDIAHLQQQTSQLPELLQRQNLTITLTGGQKVGKTSLKQLLEKNQNLSGVTWRENSAFSTEIETELTTTDLILFLTSGDLTESEWQKIQQWHNLNHSIIIVFNKQDQYLPEESVLIREQLKQRVKTLILEDNVIAIAAAPKDQKVRQHQTDGTIQEWTEPSKPTLEPLTDHLAQIITNHTPELVLATTWRQTIQLQQDIKNLTNQIRLKRALPIIEQYQWLAAATALANPVAAVDVLITIAINAQMLVDLAKIYQQQFSLSQAQTAATTIGELMLKLGLVEVSTQTIGSMLKTNAITYLAGGSVQGVSAAYLTRVAGLTLVEYFQEQETTSQSWNLEKLGAKLQQVFTQNQRISVIEQLVKPIFGKNMALL